MDSSTTATSTDERLPAWSAITIVFFANFCILVIELVAGRLMAPIVGVSLYTWTSIIGVILAGISLGNYVGGKLADRFASRRILALLFALSACGTASILGMLELVIPLSRVELPIIVSVVLVFAVVFMLPATILGTISPLVVKLTLADLRQTGDVVGKISAAGTAGSIAGTFATGFFLISTFGTRLLIWGVAGLLLLAGAFLGLSSGPRTRAMGLGMLVLFGLASGMVWQQGWLNSSCLRETNYFCIKVRVDHQDENGRVLTLDRLVHSYVYLDDPTRLRYGYEQVYAETLAALFPAGAADPLRVLFIGGGGYTFPRYIEVERPASQIDVVEIDPGVTEVARQYLDLPAETRINSYHTDARRFISRLPLTKRYDLIVGDAFNDFSVPYHLTTVEFNRLVATHLTPQGVYMVNIIDGEQGDFLRAYLHTMQQTFPHVYVAPVGGELGTLRRQTSVVLASHQPLTTFLAQPPLANRYLSRAMLTAYLETGPVITLRDDYVPVDNLLAPVFAAEGF